MHYNATLSGMFGAIDHGKIAEWISRNVYIGGYSPDKAKLKILSETLLPIYHSAVSEGHPIYKVHVSESVDTLTYVTEISGLPKSVVLQYLASLEDMAQLAVIELSVWNPLVPKNPTIPEQIGTAIGKRVSSGFNRVLIAGSIVGLLYLVAKRYLP